MILELEAAPIKISTKFAGSAIAGQMDSAIVCTNYFASMYICG
jgi:hypothetical protein